MSTAVETVPQSGTQAGNGQRTSKALEVASRGISTPRHITNFALAHSIDVLRETVGAKQANASLRGVTVGLRAVELGQRVGQHHEVADVQDGAQCQEESEQAALLRREAELTAELEAIRERRSAEQATNGRSQTAK